MAAARAAWTPKTVSEGRRARATVIAPTACDPPPTARTIASRPGSCSSISSAIVAAPAMTCGWFVECTSVIPRSRTSLSATCTATS